MPRASPPRAIARIMSGRNPESATSCASSRVAVPKRSYVRTSRSLLTGPSHQSPALAGRPGLSADLVPGRHTDQNSWVRVRMTQRAATDRPRTAPVSEVGVRLVVLRLAERLADDREREAGGVALAGQEPSQAAGGHLVVEAAHGTQLLVDERAGC